MKNPPIAPEAVKVSGNSTDTPDTAPRLGQEMSPKQMFRQPAYYLITIIFMLACMGGLMMIGFAKPIAFAKGLTETATIGVLLISVFNSAGRFIWGMLPDKF